MRYIKDIVFSKRMLKNSILQSEYVKEFTDIHKYHLAIDTDRLPDETVVVVFNKEEGAHCE
ncbi:MAG: hypothetical protein Pg6A_19800 [Termitinemataceae bacterium]|nr:MAG: hypothetical protein Pg6A_19800 [Termitinemataceae bacterium]